MSLVTNTEVPEWHTGHLIRYTNEQWKTEFIDGFILGGIFGTILAIALHRFRH